MSAAVALRMLFEVIAYISAVQTGNYKAFRIWLS
jgi:hypothetical protein